LIKKIRRGAYKRGKKERVKTKKEEGRGNQ